MKLERKHAKRLAKYLEDDMGWEVYPVDKMKCPKCRRVFYEGDVFCVTDASRLVKNPDNEDTIGLLLEGLRVVLEAK